MSRQDRQLHLPEQLDVPRDSTRLGEGEGEVRIAEQWQTPSLLPISYLPHYKKA